MKLLINIYILRFVTFSNITFKYPEIVKKIELLWFYTSDTVSLYCNCTNEYFVMLVYYITYLNVSKLYNYDF